MTTTPDMDLILPEVLVTLGAQYASMINTAFQVIDSHNHAPGSGTQVSTAGIRLDADLTFNGFNGVDLRTVRLRDETSITLLGPDLRIVYSKSGELYYRDAAGNEVQITNAGSVVGTPGNISGLVSPASATYGGGRFSFFEDTGKPGKLTISDIDLYEFGNASAQPITIKSPSSVVAYTITLPAVVATRSFTPVISDSVGNWTTLANPEILVGKVVSSVGSTGAPSYSFDGDTSTGIWNNAGDIAVSLGGSQKIKFANNGQLLISDGVAAAPAVSFISHTTSGMFNASNNLGFSVSGTESARITSTAIRSLDGSAAAPSYSFISDAGTGVYRTSGGVLGLVEGGVEAARVSQSGISSGDLASPIKWQTFLGTTSATNITIDIGSGTITGVLGYDTGTHAVFPSGLSSWTFTAGANNHSVVLHQSSAVSNSYRVLVFYV